ncbi:MAG: NYN domain-containing protein [Oryzihumus sp.]
MAPLSEAVRTRVVALAADALGRIPADLLPASLRRVAAFAPARRARLASTQIASVLATDAEFRERVGTQVRARLPELAEALDDGATPEAADPAELAAVAYLLRPDGWQQVVESAQEVVAERDRAERPSNEQLDRLRRQRDAAAEELKETKARQRERVAELKAENTELRHKLGDARERARAALAGAADAGEAAAAARAAAEAAAAAADAEARRLRARVEELEREVAGLRRAERTSRDAETMRARLLLDTLLESAQGLRRELALPAVEGTPADLVAAHEAEHGTRASSGHGSLTADDPALLEQLLGLPRAHLVVDGYNVTKATWPEQTLQQQRELLLARLAPLAARSGAEVTVVFDAADRAERPLVTRPRGVKVLFSAAGVIADDLIRDLVAAEPRGRAVVVVTSDQAIVRDVRAAGFRTAGAAALARLLARA